MTASQLRIPRSVKMKTRFYGFLREEAVSAL